MKFPVFGALGGTFAFIARNAADLLKVSWASLVLMWIGYLLIMPGYVASAIALSTMSGEGQASTEQMAVIASYAAYTAGLAILMTLTGAILFAGITRLIVTGEKPRRPFYLDWGADEWRVIACWLALTAALAGLAALGGLALALGPLMTAMGPGPGAIIGIVAIAGVGLVGVWLCARLSMSVPASIARNRIGVVPSWNATDDHVWPVIGFWVLLTIIAVLVQFVAGAFLVPPGYNEAMQGMMGGNPEDLKRAAAEMNTAMLKGYDLSDIGNFIRVSLNFLLTAAGLVLMAVAGAVAWRTLTDTDEEQTFR